MSVQGETQQLLVSLRKAIEGDRRFFVVAKTDPNFEPVRANIDHLLAQLAWEAKAKAEQVIASTQSTLTEMKAWHAQKANSSEYNSAIATMTKARESYQTDSYFGYLDALSLAKEAKRMALSAIHAQESYMEDVINRLKSQGRQFFALGGDFDNFKVKQYAPTEMHAAENYESEGYECSELKTYDSYKKAQDSLRECLTLGYRAIEKAITKGLMKRELIALNTALLFVLLSLGLTTFFFIGAAQESGAVVAIGFTAAVPLLISAGIWSWGAKKPTAAANFGGGYLWTIMFGPIMAFGSLYCILRYPVSRKAIGDRYREQLEQLRQKYTPVL